ncbi:hypothetical protein FJU08_17575 [Martelella alba]|uniref:Uncharacterized protein n=1 Tax=Martelella alba TaxID=2590451 RepID=A0A506U2M2_9HYPH|nr:hypothetical protein [Martelella alba]TPW28613.1 hypothetical protein FJU08_17575 [Martelella alba]
MKPLAAFYDQLRLKPFRWDIQRNDEQSGSGDGVYWTASLAPPLWKAEVGLFPVNLRHAEKASALIRSLSGGTPFLFRSSAIPGPLQDPTGALLGDASVTVSAVNDGQISLAGLPGSAGYTDSAFALAEWPEDDAARIGVSLTATGSYGLSVGDKLQITSAATGKTAFVEVAEDVSAGAGGTTGLFDVFPAPPAYVAAGDAVTLIKPACPCILVPGSFNAGTASGNIVSDISFSIIQKRNV